MRYMLLIYTREGEPLPMAEDQYMQGYGVVTQEMRDAGAFLAGDPLELTESATTIRVRDGKTLTTDGPSAETKEQLGGFYLIEATDLNDAIRLASRMPPARIGSIEVRPLKEITHLSMLSPDGRADIEQ